MPDQPPSLFLPEGPRGVSLNDLFVVPVDRTTDMLNIRTSIPANTPAAMAERPESGFLRWAWNTISALTLGGIYLLIVAAAMQADRWLAPSPHAALDLLWEARQWLTQAAGAEPAQVLATVLGAVLATALLNLLGVLPWLHQTLEVRPVARSKGPKTIESRLVVGKSNLHFGRLRFNFTVTDKALIVRSQNDRLIAVISASMMAKAEVDVIPGDGDEAQNQIGPWHGKLGTPPVKVTLEKGDFGSVLMIHGAHFETPGTGLADATQRAEKFCAALNSEIERCKAG